MTIEHHDTDAFRGVSFRRADLSGASLREVDLSGATVRDSDVTGLRIVASVVDEVVIDGHEGVGKVVVDDVEVTGFVRAELDRRHPERVLVREMRTVADIGAARTVLWQRWDDLLAHAATLPEPLLHERVEGEWSFVETLRHLLFAVDIWVGRMLGDRSGDVHPLGLPPTDTTDGAAAEMGLELTARPTFAEVVALHRQARARFDDRLAVVTDDDLTTVRTGVLAPDWGEESFSVFDCLRVVVNEHAEHLRFARRDLARLEGPPVQAGASSPSSQTASSESTR